MVDLNNHQVDSQLRSEIVQVRNDLLADYPLLKKFYVDKSASVVKQFATLMETIHAAAQIQNCDLQPPAKLDDVDKLRWECHHAEKLATCLNTLESPKNLHITPDNFNKALELLYFKARVHPFEAYSDCCRRVIKSLVDQGHIEEAAIAIERVATSPLFSGSVGVDESMKHTLEAELEKLHAVRV